jgi:4-aminobutyrate aminotransferase-like enzyme
MSVPLNREELKKKREKFIIPGVKQMYADPPHFVKGKGQYLFDETGREYLDMFAGIVTVSVGHCHPKVVQATVNQVNTLQHTSTIFMTQPMVDLGEKLAEITPGDMGKSFITNSGTEANEAAIRFARLATGRHEVIALEHSYHGESHLASTLTANHNWRPDTMPAAGVAYAANAYCYRCPFKKSPDSCGLECAQDVERVIQSQTSGKPAVMIAEPIQGVGGAITPPDDYFIEVKKILEKYGASLLLTKCKLVLAAQASIGLVSAAMACSQTLSPWPKVLANGLPIGAVVTTEAVAKALQKQTINTFGGNPVSAATALAVLETIEEEKLMENARVVGEYLMAGLKDLQKQFPEVIGDVRGKGLMVGMELADKNKVPLTQETMRVVEMSKDEGVVIGKGGMWGNVIRIKPPLTITKDNVDTMLKVLKKCIESVVKVHAKA